MNCIIDSRRGSDDYPGIPYNGDHTVDANWANKASEATPSGVCTAGSNYLDHDTSPFDASFVNYYVRLVVGTAQHVGKITALVDATQVTISWLTAAPANGSTVVSYFVGGAKRSVTTMSTAQSLITDFYLKTSQSFYLSGYFSDEATSAIGTSSSVYGWRGCYWKQAVGYSTITFGSSTHNLNDVIFEGAANPIMNMTLMGNLYFSNCHEITGNVPFFKGQYVSDFNYGTRMTLCTVGYNEILTGLNGLPSSMISFTNNTFWKIPYNVSCTGNSGWTNASNFIVRDNIYCSAGTTTRTTAMTAVPNNVAGDYNTFEVGDGAAQNSPIIRCNNLNINKTGFPAFAAAGGFFEHCTLHCPNDLDSSFPNTEPYRCSVQFIDRTNGLVGLKPTAAEVGTASNGGVRGAFKVARGLLPAYVIDTAENVKSWQVVSGSWSITGGSIRYDGVAPSSGEIQYPYQNHTSAELENVGEGLKIVRRDYAIGGGAGKSYAWDLQDTKKLLRLFPKVNGITASGSVFSIFDRTPTDGGIAMRVRGWTEADWTAGNAATFDSDSWTSPFPIWANPATYETCRYIVINFAAYVQ